MSIKLIENRLPVITTKRLVLRDIELSDISDEYINWLNDFETNKFLEIRLQKQTREHVEEYIKNKLENIHISQHFGVYDQSGTRLVGTVTMPTINWHHKFSDLSFVIGHPDAQGRGYATEALQQIIDYAFKVLKLEKLWAGYYDGHIASQRIFEKLGFEIEGRIRGKYLKYDNSRCDHILVGKLKEDFV